VGSDRPEASTIVVPHPGRLVGAWPRRMPLDWVADRDHHAFQGWPGHDRTTANRCRFAERGLW